jgi:16S rRNA (adenine1518-N6/adenine1519-N6)-dimethyltransferase
LFQLRFKKVESFPVTVVKHSPKKSLGQNFLVDPSIAKRIVHGLDLKQTGPIVEVGPGKGILTGYLLELDRPVIAVEKDRQLAELLVEKYREYKMIRVVSADILSTDLNALYKDGGNKKLVIIGNIPFKITSPLLDLLLAHRDIVNESILMVQKEVAKRLVSPPGNRDYGGITVIFNYFSTIRILLGVKRGSFYPAPDVDATVLKIVFDGPLSDHKARNEVHFIKVVRTLFNWRRKQVQKILKSHPDFRLKEKSLALLAEKMDFSLNCRPEELTVHDFVDLTNKISNLGV